MIPNFSHSDDYNEDAFMIDIIQDPLERVQEKLEWWAFQLLDEKSPQIQLGEPFSNHGVCSVAKSPVALKESSQEIKAALLKIKNQVAEESFCDEYASPFPIITDIPRLQLSLDQLVCAVNLLPPEELSCLFCERIRQNTRDLVLSVLQLVVDAKELNQTSDLGEFQTQDLFKTSSELFGQISKACDALFRSLEAGKTRILGEKIDALLTSLQVSVLGFTKTSRITKSITDPQSAAEVSIVSFDTNQGNRTQVLKGLFNYYKLWLTKIHFIRRLLRSIDKIFVKSTSGKVLDQIYERANKIVWGVEIVMYQLMVDETLNSTVNKVAEEVDEIILVVLGTLRLIHPGNRKLLKLLSSWERQFSALLKDILATFKSANKDSSTFNVDESVWLPPSEYFFEENPYLTSRTVSVDFGSNSKTK